MPSGDFSGLHVGLGFQGYSGTHSFAIARGFYRFVACGVLYSGLHIRLLEGLGGALERGAMGIRDCDGI